MASSCRHGIRIELRTLHQLDAKLMPSLYHGYGFTLSKARQAQLRSQRVTGRINQGLVEGNTSTPYHPSLVHSGPWDMAGRHRYHIWHQLYANKLMPLHLVDVMVSTLCHGIDLNDALASICHCPGWPSGNTLAFDADNLSSTLGLCDWLR